MVTKLMLPKHSYADNRNFLMWYSGEWAMAAGLGHAQANPPQQFYTVAETSGEFVFEWVDDAGNRGRETGMLVADPA